MRLVRRCIEERVFECEGAPVLARPGLPHVVRVLDHGVAEAAGGGGEVGPDRGVNRGIVAEMDGRLLLFHISYLLLRVLWNDFSVSSEFVGAAKSNLKTSKNTVH